VPDEDANPQRDVLPVGSDVILLSKEEYDNTLKGGELPKPLSKEQRIGRKKASENSDGEHLRPHEKPDVRLKGLMVQKELPIDTQPENCRHLWDRPVSKPQFEWVYDPRMPREWNDMVASIRIYEGTKVPSSPFRRADDSEEFVHLYEPGRPRLEQMRRQASVASQLGKDETDAQIRKLRDRFEKPVKVAYKKPLSPKKKGKGKMKPLTEEDFPRLRQQWCEEFQDIVNGTRGEMPPWREVNHEIHLYDENKRYIYHTPRCPLALRKELYEKVNRYVDSGWWEPKSVAQAAPLLCIPKRDGRLRTAIDARQRNDNTVKDVTLLPDQDIIREDVARARIRSKIDLTDAFEQVRVRIEDVSKNAFATITGTYLSHIMWIGDCNAPATFQRLMTSIFRDAIGRFMHIYLDDIFVYSESIEEHEEHLRVVFERLRQAKLYLK